MDLTQTVQEPYRHTPYRRVHYQLKAIQRLTLYKVCRILDITLTRQTTNRYANHTGTHIVLDLTSYKSTNHTGQYTHWLLPLQAIGALGQKLDKPLALLSKKAFTVGKDSSQLEKKFF